MNRIAALASLTAAVLLASCGNNPSSTPCSTNCVDISGTYTETQGNSPTGNPVGCTDGTTIQYVSYPVTFSVTQSGSALTVSGYTADNGGTLTGVMHDDLTITFNTVDDVARDPDHEPRTWDGKLYFVGQVTAGTPPTFAGTETFVRNSDRCTVKQIVTWDKVE